MRQSPDFAALLPDLTAYAAARTEHLEDAEDLVQDAMLRWLTAQRRPRTLRSTRAWFRTTVRRLAYDAVRRPQYSRDLLDQHPLSLDEPWARGE